MTAWLLDTGPLVAILDVNDPAHTDVAACLDAWSGELVTTSAVITEAMHFVARDKAGHHLLADFVTASAMEIYELSRPPELYECVSLMEIYADTPMDFADATLLR